MRENFVMRKGPEKRAEKIPNSGHLISFVEYIPKQTDHKNWTYFESNHSGF